MWFSSLFDFSIIKTCLKIVFRLQMEKRSVRSNGFVVGFGSPRNAFHKSRWRGECERRGDWKQDAGNPAACKAETTTTTTSNRTSTGGEGRNCQAHLDSNNLSFRRNQPSPGILFRRRRFVFVFRLLIGDRVFRPRAHVSPILLFLYLFGTDPLCLPDDDDARQFLEMKLF